MTKYHRYVYRFEVLSETEIESVSLADLHEMTTEGHCSGMFLETEHREVDGPEMAELLIRQHSDPEFFGLPPNQKDR